MGRFITRITFIALMMGCQAFAQAPAKVDFGRDVRPILNQHCVGCHGQTQQMNGFRLDRPVTRFGAER